MDTPTSAENINPLDAVEADWALIRVVEAAHSHFHMRPSLATAQALSAATDLYLSVYGGVSKVDIANVSKAEALRMFADHVEDGYALDQSTPAALLKHIVSLARRDADLAAR